MFTRSARAAIATVVVAVVGTVSLSLQGCGGDASSAPAVYAMKQGTCCCPVEHMVQSKAQCLDALHMIPELLNFTLTHQEVVKNLRWEGTDSNVPTACSFKRWPNGTTGRGHWNHAGVGQARHDMIPICLVEAHGVDNTMQLYGNIRGKVAGNIENTIALPCLAGVSFMAVAVMAARRVEAWGPERDTEAMSLITIDEELAAA
jgi:hypothetical protein